MRRLLTSLPAFALLALPMLAAPAANAAPVSWAVDKSHSEVGFSVQHLVISRTKGEFKDFHGTVTLDDDNPKNNKIEAFIDINSIDTSDAKRDDHLRSPDFFDAKKFPTMKFTSTRFKKGKKGWEVFGKLTMHGVTKPVVLFMEGGPSIEVNDPWGGTHRAFTLTGKVNRKQFGLMWDKQVEGTGAVVGDEITLDIAIELFDKGLKKHGKDGKKLATR
jgi:polyisoprenoid-binding protein YceI